jgi:hypothetical protein
MQHHRQRKKKMRKLKSQAKRELKFMKFLLFFMCNRSKQREGKIERHRKLALMQRLVS